MAGMASSRTDEIPKLDMESPRIIAAMKVTGIDVADLTECKMPELSPNSSRKEESLQRRADLMDRKRRQLIKELDDTAAALDESLVDAILSPSSIEASMAMDAQELLEVEKQKIDGKREKVKDEIQKELEREMERKQAFENTQKSREEWRKRVKERRDGRAEEISKREDERNKRDAKMDDKLKSARKGEIDRRRDLQKKLVETEKRVAKVVDVRQQNYALEQEERRKKISDIAQRNLENRQADEDEKIRKLELSLQREREREERRQKAHEKNSTQAEQKRAKFSDKMTFVSERLQEEHQRREDNYKEHVDKLDSVRQAGKEHNLEVAQRARTAREKDLGKWQSNRERLRKDYRERMGAMRAEFSESHAKSIEVRERHLEENVYRKAEMKGYLVELVDQNKARIARSDACAREQTLAKIRHTQDKIESHLDQRRQILEYRTNALKDEMVGKTQLNDLKTIMRDASTQRINQILKELDMPLLPTEPAKEEGEEATKQ